MVAEPVVTQAANRPFIPMAEGLGPQELYYCQVEAMLGTLLGRLLVMGLYCLLIAGWQGALLGMALLLVLGWRQIMRHKDRPDLLRYNYYRAMCVGVFLMLGPLLIRLGYAVLQAWEPGVLDVWLDVTAPIVEYLSQHLSTFEEMRRAHAKRFAATAPAEAPRLDLALHMQMLHWLSLPTAFLFAPQMAWNFRLEKPLERKDWVKLAKSYTVLQVIPVISLTTIFDSFGTPITSRSESIQFSIFDHIIVQFVGFVFIFVFIIYTIALINSILSSILCSGKCRSGKFRLVLKWLALRGA